MVTAIYIGVVIGLGGESNMPKIVTQAQSANVIRALGDIVSPLLPEDLSEQVQAGLGEADIEALTPDQPKFIENGLDAVSEQKDITSETLNLLSDEQN